MHFEFISLEELYKNLDHNPIFINDLSLLKNKDISVINDILMTVYDNQNITTLSSCLCGELKGNFRTGKKCPRCETLVEDIDSPLTNNLWIRNFEGVERFLNPYLWIMLDNILTKKRNFSVLNWLVNSNVKVPHSSVILIDKVKAALSDLKLERNYNFFIRNMFDILDRLFEIPNIRSNKRSLNSYNIDNLKILLRTLPDDILFTRYLPLPNKRFITMEKTTKGRYADFTITDILDIIYTVAQTDIESLSYNKKNLLTSKIMIGLSNYYLNYFKNFWKSKNGLMRHHVFSTRTYFSFRCVLSSLNEFDIEYDELAVPWGVILTAFRPHILNKLIKRNYSYLEANKLLILSINKYNEIIHEIINELLKECKYKGLPVLINRNPTFFKGSILKLFITRIKTDLRDNTLSFHPSIFKSLNADVDGDEISCMLCLDNIIAEEADKFDPSTNIYNPNNILEVSNNLYMPKNVIATIHNWINN